MLDQRVLWQALVRIKPIALFLARRRKLSEDIGEIDEAIGMADTAEERKRLTQIREGMTAELMLIDGESRNAFENLSEGPEEDFSRSTEIWRTRKTP